ncbi:MULTISPECIES: hypothetical protein [unclassified Pseudoxanthomonas]|uniref:hypothetical protein n=1 Tax=unclassified Pseudoxanthomonas TaxID=2645906 RepID=UPI00240D0402|nr:MULTISPECIES: hypothetical protein [unclassified Pseudoxanthomonas]WFC40211.1 hypothetical protein OY559_10080 [Pseudoxanthomonas sp. SE1]
MKQHVVDRRDVLSGILLLALGLLTMGTAVFFLVLRPALLPEDIRHTGIDPGTLAHGVPGMARHRVPRLGRFIAGLGVLLLGSGGFLLSGRARLPVLGHGNRRPRRVWALPVQQYPPGFGFPLVHFGPVRVGRRNRDQPAAEARTLTRLFGIHSFKAAPAQMVTK